MLVGFGFFHCHDMATCWRTLEQSGGKGIVATDLDLCSPVESVLFAMTGLCESVPLSDL